MKIAILGFGTVGSGVYEIAKTLKNIEVKKVLEKDLSKINIATDNYDEIINDKEIELVVECMGGLHPAYEFIMQALKSKKPVVSANKAVIAKYLDEFLQAAKENNVEFRFEASVGGGIPCLAGIQKIRRVENIDKFYGIFNGTSNFILDNMYRFENEFFTTLKTAQELGYAEADPSADIDGYDVTNKVIISFALAYDGFIKNEFPCFTMRNITKEDILYFKKNGLIAKYIGEATTVGNEYEASVMLNLFPTNALEGNVLSNYNIVTVQSHTMGEVKFYGQGAGKLPTANAIIQDILDIQANISFNPISIEKKYSYSAKLFKHRYVLRSNEELKGEFDKIEKDGNNFYHYTKEITQADLLKVIEGKDCLVTKLSEVLA
ncbi:homoserine dehydrogenase [Fusobacterium pseudoperiodonticum]|uniref:Homoserine dehydrogenase n=1 Tax=Fusobacterium pseudoperiodonticum TaxID=2663009 RepID=A0AAD0ARJ4_9FUSO|nr:homoserine dehydrogenase [Fusobacterium pseudoperiodonticum]ATV34720.1 homoserine dehydrogenase [Fusobacterium pseudoperiodonticum]ATV62387.1 homoserine dehydrogenase [Fusobacterium pseudoperiodonticum]